MPTLRDRVMRGFELTIIYALMVLIAAMVAMGTISLALLFVRNVGVRMGDVADAEALQRVMQRGFGGALAVLLGLELIETLKQYTAEHRVRVETVFLVGLIAVGRHVIQVDYAHAPMGELFGMAAVILALAAGYFLVRRGAAGGQKSKEGHTS